MRAIRTIRRPGRQLIHGRQRVGREWVCVVFDGVAGEGGSAFSALRASEGRGRSGGEAVFLREAVFLFFVKRLGV